MESGLNVLGNKSDNSDIDLDPILVLVKVTSEKHLKSNCSLPNPRAGSGEKLEAMSKLMTFV